MEKDTAEQLLTRARGCIRIFNDMIEFAQCHCDKGEERVVRHAVGYTLSELLDRLMVPIFTDDPDLVPEGLDYGPLDGPKFSELAAKMKQEPPPSEPRRGHEPQGCERGTPSMDKDTAKQLMARAFDCMRLVNEMTEVALSNGDEDELRVVRRAAGHTIAEMYERLIDPVLREYPDLLPEGIDYTPLKGPTFTELAAQLRPASPPSETGSRKKP
ncbi:hypothetical protein [Polyangium mundeleinium]|uniref:Uncharacterized protein n=1 Tax=Polyangium mundeleinium TaxID=2995306 RepID=A0ABT5EDM9_9BACT|nr:hypothetical protein [Polyangium mundeleinium]MDC0739918.1 hypothetical protein [Polyangium mundeleinium]